MIICDAYFWLNGAVIKELDILILIYDSYLYENCAFDLLNIV